MPDRPEYNRRRFLGHSISAVASAGALRAASAEDPVKKPSPADQTGTADMPVGTIGSLSMSRLMLGGNLVSGYMHARDLKYVSQLFRAYCDAEKMFETFRVAEENGIDVVLESGAAQVRQYNEKFGGKLRVIPSVHPEIGQDDAKLKAEIVRKVDEGAPALYVWGVAGDTLVRAEAVDRIASAVRFIQDAGVPAGVGCHSNAVPVACEKAQVPCDFYVKTLHEDSYPSATPKDLRKDFLWLGGGPGWNDNMWCIDAEEAVEVMGLIAKPWIAFKVLAAGAIPPRQGFAHAFANGADFIAVGMFDFQVTENCELVRRLVSRERKRSRPWYV